MSELLHKLGLDWKLLLAQAVNFLVILFILRMAAYKPIMRMLNDRRKKIEQGLENAKIAAQKLASAEGVYASKIREAETDAVKIFAKLESDAKAKEAEMLSAARLKEAEILKAADKARRAKEEEAEEHIHARASALVRSALEKTVKLDPGKIDDALIAQALEAVKKTNV